MARRILLIGATGVFGRRLARHLAALPDVDLLLASRDLGRASTLVAELTGAGRTIEPVALDRTDPEIRDTLCRLAPWLVIDASGPFQSASYDLAEAALDAGAHWIDLADARDYLLGFETALDARARQSGLAARTGASSTPALSFAVVEALVHDWQRVDSIDIAIMPGGAGEVGRSVIEAILSYAGQEIPTFREGRPASVTGWGTLTRTVVPGLGVRYLSPVDTADAELLPQRFAVTSRVSFSAGLESRVEHFGMRALAGLRRRGVVSGLPRLASTLESARRVTRLFASDRGAMTVDCSGIDPTGRQRCARWTLIAKQGDGPHVPVLPALALTRKLLSGEFLPGAGLAAGVLKLADIEAEMRVLAITTSRDAIPAPERSLLGAALGETGYHALPEQVRAFHDASALPVWEGTADIDAENGLLAWLTRRLFRFPPPGRDVPVIVTVDRQGAAETWTRNFGGRRFASRLTEVGPGRIAERFGPFSIELGATASETGLRLPVTGWRLGRLPLPAILAPRSDASEFVDELGRFRFDVAISLPYAGRVAHYRGWLEPRRAGQPVQAAPKEKPAGARRV